MFDQHFRTTPVQFQTVGEGNIGGSPAGADDIQVGFPFSAAFESLPFEDVRAVAKNLSSFLLGDDGAFHRASA